MIGKILDQGRLVAIFSPIIKTSNSGMFGNKRLAILSFRQATLGYQSKVPDSVDIYQDINCIQNCKETVTIRNNPTFTFHLSINDLSTLVIKWHAERQKCWEFKFQNPVISQQWYQSLVEIVNMFVQPPIKKQEPQGQKVEQEKKNIDFSKLKNSRFSNLQLQNRQGLAQSGSIDKIQKNEKKQPLEAQQKTRIISDQPKQYQYRFKDFQRENNINYQSVSPTTPIITTFRQKFPNNTIFNSIKRQNSEASDLQFSQNWNIIWYQAIDTEQEQVRIDIYNSFLCSCQKICTQIIQQLTVLKPYRNYVPEKFSLNEEIYSSHNITFHLVIQKDIQSSQAELCSNSLLQQFQKLQQNYTFILKATKNKGLIKVPLSCIFQYHGFSFYCQAKIPPQFFEVDHSDKYIFHPQFLRLQEQIKLRINLSTINIYTNKISSIAEQSRAKRNHYLILKDIKKILPETNSQGINYFTLSKHFFLQSSDIYPKDYDFAQEKSKWITKFLKAQDTTCTIISSEDLKQSLQMWNLSYYSIYQMYLKSQNKYLSRVFISEFVSQTFCHIVKTEIMIFVKKWNKNIENMIANEVPDYQAYTFQLLAQFLSENISTNIRIWNIISNQLFSKLELTIKPEDIIIGYLLSSISFKLGINLDYQLLILQKDNFFGSDILISPQSIKSFEPLFINFKDQDMCDSFQAMMHEIQNHQDQTTLVNVQKFYHLNEQEFQHHIEPYHWKKICRLFSFFVPYERQQQYSYLSIYSGLNFLFLDYSTFCILVSAIKWLFHANRVDDAVQFVYFFKQISWFWVSETNPFIIVLFQIVGQYFRVTGNMLSSIEYISKCNQLFENLLKGNVELDNLDRNYKLAQIYMACSMHKQSLNKYHEIKRIYRKSDKETLNILDILVEISKLYLHLGDIQNCFRTCKQLIEFSILNPFKSQEQEYQMYSILLRGFQIREDYSKYKFYVDIIQEKFKYTKNPIILQGVLRLTLQQILRKYNKYQLKKFAFVLYIFQKYILPIDEDLSLQQLYKRLMKQIGNEIPSKMLISCMEYNLDISDLMIEREADIKDTYKSEEIIKHQNMLELYCQFIGFESILGNIANNIRKDCLI